MDFGTRWSSRTFGALLLTLLLLGVAGTSLAHEDPPGCNQTGPQLILGVFFANGTTGVSGTVNECETLVYRVTLSKPNDPTVCAFEAGTLTITTPDGVVHDVTPATGIPCLGGTTAPCNPGQPPVTGQVTYVVRPVDVSSGQIQATANYKNGIAHDFTPDTPGVSAATPKTTPIHFCSDNLVCNGLETCDQNAVFGVNNSRKGNCVPGTPLVCPGSDCAMNTCVEPTGCVKTNKPDSTACSHDANGNPIVDTAGDCVHPGCEAGVCVANHLKDPDSTTCSVSPTGAPITDAPGDCVHPGCEAGACVANHVKDPDSTPCTDTDGKSCTQSGCDAGVCNQQHISNCPTCGNGVLEPGETCDPPDPTPDPNRPGQVKCRPDCTFCGDSVVQTDDGESCDDGNLTSGCDPAHPTIPLDLCQNNCTPPICSDPARIKLRPSGDSVSVHGRIMALPPATTIDLTTQTLKFELTGANSTIYSADLPAGAITGSNGHFRYTNKAAKTTGGVTKLKMTATRAGVYRFKIEGFGDLSAATQNMTTHLTIGSTDYTVIGTWHQITKGWRLNFSDIYFHP